MSIDRLALLTLSGLLLATGVFAQESEAVWEALRSGGHIAIMRHALAPGTGDPAELAIGDCTTQRNLSERGRDQARRIGRAFRRAGVPVDRVLTSQWCRCRETAELLGLGPVEDYPVLNSFFRERDRGPAQTDALRAFVGRPLRGANVVLVTHQVNITALTGVFPSSGDVVVIRPSGDGEFAVVGRISTDPGKL